MSESTEPLEEPGNGIGDLLDVPLSPLGNDDKLTAVLGRRPRAKLPALTLLLAALVVAVAGFIGGILVGKHYGSSGSGRLGGLSQLAAGGTNGSAASGRGTSGGARAGSGAGLRIVGGAASAGAGGAGGAGGLAAGNATIGTIKLVDGSTVYVQTSAGDIVQVSTSKATKVTASSTVPVKDLQPGETVVVEGSKNSSGGVSATSINQASLGAGLGG